MRGWHRPLAAGLLALAAWSLGGLWALASPPVPTMSQRAQPWSRQALGSDPVDTIGSSGCAPTAVTMVASACGDALYFNDPWFGDRTALQARYGSYRKAVHSAQIYYRN